MAEVRARIDGRLKWRATEWPSVLRFPLLLFCLPAEWHDASQMGDFVTGIARCCVGVLDSAAVTTIAEMSPE